MKCRHGCNRKGQRGKRGLCYLCAFDPDIRTLYPSLSKFGRHADKPKEIVDDCGLPAPTMARRGSEEKVVVLTERATRRERLWHPADAV